MTYSEEQDSRERSQALAYQKPEVLDPLKVLVRKQINDTLFANREQGEVRPS